MHHPTRTKPLGGQQALRLRQLRALNDSDVHQKHLQRQKQLASEHIDDKSTAVNSHGGRKVASRTVEAILEERTSEKVHGQSTATRLRNKIEAARGNIHTERSDRSEANNQHEPLVPLLDASSVSKTHRPKSEGNASAKAFACTTAQQRQENGGPIRKIGAVRRRANPESESGSTKRRQTKEELEWIEKQLQFAQRISVLEKECASWWQHFYSSSGVSSGVSSNTAALIHKHFEEFGGLRAHDARQMRQQLHGLRQKVRSVSDKLESMRNGDTFYADLQELIEDLENSIAAFRLSQRERYDEYAMDEKLLDKDLKAFIDKMSEWEVDTGNRSSARTTAKGSRSMRTTSALPLSRPQSNQTVRADDTSLQDPEEEGADVKGEAADESDMIVRVRHLNDLILQSGGMKGGWDDREHGVFTTLLLKHGLTDDILLKSDKCRTGNLETHSPNQQEYASSAHGSIDYETSVARFLRKCIKKIITKSDNAVRGHFIWYLDHIRLIQQKKDVISEWKLRKEQEREQIIHQGLVEVNSNVDSLGASPNRQKSDGVDESRRQLLEAKSKVKKDKMLHKWREAKERKQQEQREKESELEREREAREAKRKQELSDAKQKVLLYKLQKEQESTRTSSGRSRPHSQLPSASPRSSPAVSPVSKEELMERSRQAIEYAKAKRAKLQELEEQRQKQRALPKRPALSGTKGSGSSPSASPTDRGNEGASHVLLLQPTKVSQARERSKVELRRKDKERRRQNAHDAYIPGAGAIPDVKLKSFGHVPIQPRAVPAWRRNI